MKYAIHKGTIEHLWQQRNYWISLAILLSGLCLGLIIYLVETQGRERIILVPPVIHQTVWIDNDTVSESYLAEMTYYFADLRLNVTPSTVVKQHELFKKYIAPKEYARLKKMLKEETSLVEKEKLSTLFYPTELKIEKKKMQVIIKGELMTLIGDKKLPTQEVQYLLLFKLIEGRLLITEFREVKDDD